jgi:DNA invertase Pin-like site-specific DNA recombinase
LVGAEFEEKAVSASKVSADKRDAIIDLKEAARKGEFQVLLIFMFDRLGRIDDETPFVLEWFVKNGIEVWSVNEGEQKIEQHVDKLMNYIRFWQAAGESEKTSIRTKTRLGQIVQEGYFRGGGVPFGYTIEKQGRINKSNQEVNEIIINDEEASIVRLIFDLFISKGYGTQRIATFLLKQGIKNRNGNNFINSTIANMLKNKSYIGILKSGETVSNIFQHLQIIDPAIFETTQNILLQRSKSYKERRVPLNTKGKSLVSGNIFCGHCGARLILSTSGKKHTRLNGITRIIPKYNYVCYNRRRHPNVCDGQTAYVMNKIDDLVEIVVHSLFEHLNDVPKEAVIAEKYINHISEYQKQLDLARANFQKITKEISDYEAEVIKVIRGESKINHELLNKLYDEAKLRSVESEQTIKMLEQAIQNSTQMKDSCSKEYDTFKSWADIYDDCDLETKKMIISRIIKTIKVR